MATTIEILAAEGRDIKLPSETVHVREMPWTDTLAVLRAISEFSAQFITKNDATGVASLNTGSLLAVITKSEELAAEIVARSTGKDRDWMDQQSPRAVLAILDAAIDVNMSEQVQELGKAVGRRFGFGAAGKIPTPSSAT